MIFRVKPAKTRATTRAPMAAQERDENGHTRKHTNAKAANKQYTSDHASNGNGDFQREN